VVKEDTVWTRNSGHRGEKAVGLTAAEICVGTAKIHAHGLIEQSKKRNSTEQEVQSSIEDSK
jgi:hypothetical protein